MPTKLDPTSDRVEACERAVEELKRRHGKAGVPATENAMATATGLRQQNLNKLSKHRAIGIEFADEIAAQFDTTVDGLVWLFLRGGDGAVRVGDIPGWQRAVAEATDQWGEQGYRYDLAAEVRLPIAPRRADKVFARDLARLLHEHTATSHTRLKAQQTSG